MEEGGGTQCQADRSEPGMSSLHLWGVGLARREGSRVSTHRAVLSVIQGSRCCCLAVIHPLPGTGVSFTCLVPLDIYYLFISYFAVGISLFHASLCRQASCLWTDPKYLSGMAVKKPGRGLAALPCPLLDQWPKQSIQEGH